MTKGKISFIKCMSKNKNFTTSKKLCALTTLFQLFKKKIVLLSIIMLLIALNKNTKCMLGKINDEFSQAKIPKWRKLNEPASAFPINFLSLSILYLP